MNKMLQANRNITQDASIAQCRRVCMHVLGVARTDNRVMREATSLAEAGFAVSIIDVEANSALPVEENIQGIHVRHIIMPSWYVSTRFKPWFLIKLSRLFLHSVLQLMQVQANIYHAHDDHALLPCFIVACLRHKPLVFDAHELPLSDPAVTRWRRLTKLSRYLFTRMISRCAGVITVSSPIAEEIYRNYHAKKVTLVRNTSPYRVISKSNKLRQYLAVSSDIRIVLYQGGLQTSRELDRLILAAKFLEPDILIVIMGNGSIETTSQLKTLIVTERVVDRVKLIPSVPYEDLLDWTASADIGVIIYSPDYSLNLRMCLPNKLFEYLMAGLPVLSSQLDAVVEVIKAYDVGQVISSLTPEDIAAAINAMLADRVALVRQRQKALEVAQHEFYWEKERTRLIDLYHNTLGKLNMEHEAQKMVVHDELPFAEL